MPRTKASTHRTGSSSENVIKDTDRELSESVGSVRTNGMAHDKDDDNEEEFSEHDYGEEAAFVGDDDDDVEEDEEEEDHVTIEDNANEAFSNHFEHVVGDRDNGDDVVSDPLLDEKEDVPEEVNSENPENGAEEILKLDKCFSSGADFKATLLRYSLITRYDIRLYISNMKKLGAVFSDKKNNCPWRVYCSYEKRKRKLQIKVLESKHTCIRSGYSKLLKCSTIAQLFEDKLRINPTIRPVDMVVEIKTKYNLIFTEDQCRKAKAKLSKQRRKMHEKQFARIWDYEAELHKINQGTTVDIETIPGPTPGSCRIVSIAWAVVDIENDINWDCFFAHLKVDLGLSDGAHFTVISDKKKGLVKAIQVQLPETEHRQCARHVLGN